MSGVTGKLFANCKETEIGGQAQDPKLVAKLWELSEQLAQVSSPTVPM